MPAANIKINAVAASNDDLPINTLVNLDNANTGGEVSFLWVIVDQPPGAADALSSTVVQNPTLTPKKEGTYLLQLTVNGTLVDRKIVGVRQLKTRERVPAAQEVTEDGTRGWAGAAGSFLQHVDRSVADPVLLVGVLTTPGHSRGAVLKTVGSTTIKSGLPGQEVVPSFDLALATAHLDDRLFVLESGVDGNTSPAAGALVIARSLGQFVGATGVPTAVRDPVFVSNAGVVSLASGTNQRRVGAVTAFAAGAYNFMVDGGIYDPFVVVDDQQAANVSSNSAVFVAATGYPNFVVTVPGTRSYTLGVGLSMYMTVAFDEVFFQVMVDGSPVAGQPIYAAHMFFNTLSEHTRLFWQLVVPLTAGAHTINLQWKTTGLGTANSTTFDYRSFTLVG
jgi:hypothetical protein